MGVEVVGPYRIHFEGFSDYCQQDALDRCNLPKGDPRRLEKYEDVYAEVLNDFIMREHGRKPIDSGLVGDSDYPIYYAIFDNNDSINDIDESIDRNELAELIRLIR